MQKIGERLVVGEVTINPHLTIRHLERALDAREGFLPFIGGDDEFNFLHRDARYLAITKELGIGVSRGVTVTAMHNPGSTK